MKKRRALLLILLTLLLVVGIPTGLLVREYRREQASKDLIAAIKADNTPAALAALKAGADPNVRDHSEDNPLPFGEHIKQLLHTVLHPNTKKKPDDAQTALLLHLELTWDSDKTNMVLVKALLDAGANPNLHGRSDTVSNWNPINSAIMLHRIDLLHLLFAYGGDANSTDEDGWTLLHSAALFANADATKLLLDRGANVHLQDKSGESPLHCACQGQNLICIQTLIAYHCYVNLRDTEGRTPLDYALSRYGGGVSPTEEKEMLAKPSQFITVLRQAGAKTGKELSSQSTTPASSRNTSP